jgi:hypothetical protein
MAQKQEVKIRFNTGFSAADPGTKEWRVLINGKEHFCNHVQVNCPSYTSNDLIEGVGQKWHISCQAGQIEFIKDTSRQFPANFFKEIVIS